ncbi:MAG: nucleoside recognition domain-containing protein, partial [Anaerotignum sp.]
MKKSSLVLGFCACFLIYALLRFPEAMLAASAESVQLWLTKVFPSLFPFIAACGLLLWIGAAERMGAALRPLMQPLFGLPGIAAFPFFLGILSGYPMGAKMTAMLYEKK